jgi:hypothetical protein
MFPFNSTREQVERARILIADATPMGAQLLADALRRSGRFAGVPLQAAPRTQWLCWRISHPMLC